MSAGTPRSSRNRRELLDRQPVGTGPFQLSGTVPERFIRLQRHVGLQRGKPLMPQVVKIWKSAVPGVYRNY